MRLVSCAGEAQGDTLQGYIATWQVIQNKLINTTHYRIESVNEGVIFTSTSNTPYPPNFVDESLNFYVKPGDLPIQDFGKCTGLKIIPIKSVLPIH